MPNCPESERPSCGTGKIHNGKQLGACRRLGFLGVACGTVRFTTGNNATFVVLAGGSLSRTRPSREFHPKHGHLSTSCSWKEFRVTVISDVWIQRYVNRVFKEVPKQAATAEKKRLAMAPTRRGWVICAKQGEQTMDLAGIRRRLQGNRRDARRRSKPHKRLGTLGLFARKLS